MSSNYAVSVIVPIYNVEAYIERCARSLFEQTLDNIEYIFVDDCSPDNSVALLEKVLESYPNRKKDVKILHHRVNQGLVATKQTGFKVASGEYLISCDSDDWVDTKMYQTLYDRAKHENCDFVYCYYYEVRESEYTERKSGEYETRNERISAVLTGAIGSYPWCKMAKREIYRQITFPLGHDMWEDLTIAVQLFFYAQRVSLVKEALYFYNQDNMKSIMHASNEKNMKAMIANAGMVDSFLSTHGILLKKEMNNCKICCKQVMITSGVLINEWDEVFPEVNKIMCCQRSTLFYIRAIAWGLNYHITFPYKTYHEVKRILRKY